MSHLALRLVLLSVLAAPGFAMAADASFCDSYAEKASHEAVLAGRFACTFHGPRWVSDVEAHRAWCLGAQESVVHAEATARTKDIRLCMCEWYAEHATAQAAMNAAHQCQFTGPRWTPDRSAHYRWCILANASLATLESEIKTRKDALAECLSR
jgi:hypothetical protein